MSHTTPLTGSPRFAELDGLRALAVVSVILFHCEITGVFNAGFFGVDMFFTISGFIITSILLKEYRSEGDFRFLNFYFRRLKRLLPPVLGLVLIAFLGTSVLSPDALRKFIADTPAAFLYLSNWWQIVDRQDYFDTTPHVLRHLWSLAIEEQFYIVWPPLVYLVLKRGGPRAAGVLALAATLGSTAWMWHLYELNIDAIDQNRIYLGTDTHAMGLLTGAALACFWNPWLPRAVGPLARLCWRALALLALALLGAMIGTMDTSNPWLYRGAFLVVPLLTCIVAYVTMGDREFFVSALLRTRVVQWFGLRSYSLYLVHWLVFVWMRLLGFTDFARWDVFLPALAVVLIVSEAMYQAVEKPAIRYELKQAGDTPKKAVLGAYVIIALLFSTAIRAVEFEEPAPVIVASAGAPAVLPPLPVAEPKPAPQPAAVQPAGAIMPAEEDIDPGVRISGGEHLYALGDSVLLGARDHLRKSIPGIEVDAAVGRQVRHGLKIVQGWQDRLDGASTVLVHLGTNGYINEGQLRELLGALARCKTVLLVTVHADRRWTAPNNELIARMTREFPNTRVLDWNAASAARPDWFVKDGIHLSRRGILAYAARIEAATGGTPLPLPEPAPAPAPLLEKPRRTVRAHADAGAHPRHHQQAGATGEPTAAAVAPELPAAVRGQATEPGEAAHNPTSAPASEQHAGRQAGSLSGRDGAMRGAQRWHCAAC
ncbi:acyltransferase family protein [Pseudoduganella chitinolytica]|uniref:Acyltransferase family protein n=1 Tax=Pseudoduganella chitinolytica TaxID=34070 RepID=A0ABY8BG66_9BURK|nr:acyltransferase family protein [Pseudoduganella chitinolytica]WEF34293.1 acyltransferase family protein [Pseudoduganella chitinolytica]